MAHTMFFFTAPEDEVALFRFLGRLELEVYPRRVPQDWKPFRPSGERIADLPADDLYLVASGIRPAYVDKVKRGPDKGFWRIDEVRSPVVFMQRSFLNEDQELGSGKLWAELDITPQTGRRDAAPDQFRRLYMEIEEFIKKAFRRGDPKDFFVGPRAARLAKEGLVLRDSKFRGGTVVPYK